MRGDSLRNLVNNTLEELSRQQNENEQEIIDIEKAGGRPPN